MRLEAIPVAGLDVLDVAFAVDAELDVEAAGFVAAHPRHAPPVVPQDIHRDVEDVGVARKCAPSLLEALKKAAPVTVRAHAVRYRVGDGSEGAQRRGDSQVVELAGRLPEVAAATGLVRFLRRPHAVQAEGLVVIVASAVEPDLFV